MHVSQILLVCSITKRYLWSFQKLSDNGVTTAVTQSTKPQSIKISKDFEKKADRES